MKTDIVVIGSGGAGLIAACAARRAGREVMLLTKSRAGMANCTTYAGGGFTGPYGSVSPEEHRRKTLEIGRNINIPYMLDALSFQARERVPALSDFGVKIDFIDGHASVSKYGLSELMGGTGMTLPLVEYAQKAGVKILNSTMVTGLFYNDNRVTGVRTLSTQTGQFSSVSATAVIVATGGAGRLYSRTDNPVRTTGDGFALLYEAGVPMVDMEFVQFYPMGYAEPGFPVWMIGLDFADVAPITNSTGEEFLREKWNEWGIKNGREANSFTRDRSSIAIASEWFHGREVFLHVERVPEKMWETRRGRSIRRMFPPGRTPVDGPIRVKPVQHYFPGGALVNPDCSTGIDGLFACGEVTGGTDGANRIGGNALSMITVFGFRAAESAVDYCLGKDPVGVPASHPADQLADSWSQNEDLVSAGSIKQAINKVADEKVFVVRTAESTSAAIDEFNEIEDKVMSISARGGEQLMEAYEARNLLTVGKLVSKAAHLRTESRGVHFREDYPCENQESWMKHLVISQKNDRMTIEEVSVDAFGEPRREDIRE